MPACASIKQRLVDHESMRLVSRWFPTLFCWTNGWAYNRRARSSSVVSLSHSAIQGITKLWHIYILSLMTPLFALGSHLSGIRRSPGSCEFPVVRKLADVLPVWKKSKKDEISNYGPYSLNSVPDKIMEKMMLGVTENTWKTILSLETANTSSWREGPVELKVLLLRSHPPNWWKEANWCYCLGFHIGF